MVEPKSRGSTYIINCTHTCTVLFADHLVYFPCVYTAGQLNRNILLNLFKTLTHIYITRDNNCFQILDIQSSIIMHLRVIFGCITLCLTCLFLCVSIF